MTVRVIHVRFVSTAHTPIDDDILFTIHAHWKIVTKFRHRTPLKANVEHNIICRIFFKVSAGPFQRFYCGFGSEPSSIQDSRQTNHSNPVRNVTRDEN